ncbi:TPA: NAD-dependent succinate-semialdehyde dehydrogenase [Aeromonas veronii]|uniref:NAD-dependent succinate-semialdehyde dehydrogenase n=1 Tax=Aeromonas veronii TaxID=654 RepID=A0AAN1QD32_AERVE|nr:NAD-dependent succinate-semialdehyde dehydrogenase [Aeromonas veronii]AYV36538.1 NAD-dependent succinate-semialdehyde dehydrogenase [Aeromonas veronii]EKP0297357.1 NAD-dependent succinate-semialdehyde dehydrogenase [Aeromonas veronii]MCX0437515.1 NAD-dependent succinate-semialdehyde dehydrogenase [Aeromonas veronii]MCX0441556.1 NAD-dependent succinate-semialdehyde dehydrogenase [Aeromonas veronii]
MFHASIEPLLEPFCHWQRGVWRSSTGPHFDVFNPATGALLATVADQGAAVAKAAITHAHAALPAWQAKSAKERSALLRRWFELIMEHQEPLALLMTLEQGKPLAEARGEVVYGASYVEWFAEETKRLYGDILPAASGDRRLLTIKQGIGVVAAITPWNFPSAMITRKVAPALGAGCTVVLKPSDETPLSALALVTLARQAGIPEAVFQIVTGKNAAAIGDLFCSDGRVRKLTFTGSTPVGKRLMAQCADTVKKMGLELGGNAPFIVFDDADIDAAIKGLMLSKFRNAGQTCICANRILVQAGIYDAFVAKLVAAVAQLKVAPGTEAGATIGPLVNGKAVEKVESLVADAIAKGASLLAGGERARAGKLFYQPTVLGEISRSMAIFDHEIFGPVAALMRFESEDEAIALANDTPFGLAAYFYSQNMGRIWRVAERLEYGMVGINEGGISSEVAPFGGVKESGLGREGSKYGLEEFTEIKYLCLGGLG